MPQISDFEYQDDKLLGKGAWGEVYLGNQISLNRPVAIKILKKELSQDQEFVKRFLREAQCLAKLVDEHIIQVYFAGECEGSHLFVMEYVQGMPLQKFIDKGRKFSPEEVIYVGLSVARALKTAWESPAQIVHRDIKPSNIMVSFTSSLMTRAGESREAESLTILDYDIKEAKIKVMDFGLAKSRSEDKDGGAAAGATLAGTVIGTPKYISPEQGLGNPADIRSDIYSLGIVLYEMATGRIPFQSETVMSLIRHHIYDTPTSPTQFNQDIPPELEAVILKCIQKDPNQRYQSPNELIEDLEAVRQARQPLYASQLANATGATIVLQPTRKKTPLFVGIVAGVVLIAVVGYFVRANKNTPPLSSGGKTTSPHTPPQTEPDKFAGLIGQAKIALKLGKLPEAENFIIQASAIKIDSPELDELIKQYHASKPTQSKEEITKKVTALIKNAKLSIDSGDFEEARKRLGEAYFLEPDNPEIDRVYERLKQKQTAVAPPPTTHTPVSPTDNSAIIKRIRDLIQEGRDLLSKKNTTEARRRLADAYSLATNIPDIPPEIKEEIETVRKQVEEEEKLIQAEQDRIQKEREFKKFLSNGISALNERDWERAAKELTEAMKYSNNDNIEEVQNKLAEAHEGIVKIREFNALVTEADEAKHQDKIDTLKTALGKYTQANCLEAYLPKAKSEGVRENISHCKNRLNLLYLNEGMDYYTKQQIYLKAKESYQNALLYKSDDQQTRDLLNDLNKLLQPPKGMLFIDGGRFKVGELTEGKFQEIFLPPFFIDIYEVTNEEYKRFLDNIKEKGHRWCHKDEPKNARGDPKSHNPVFWGSDDFPAGEEKIPVVGVDWYDAYAYANWCGKRLPTVVEWERAARGTDGRIYPWGDELPPNIKVNIKGKGTGKLSAVGSFPDDTSPDGCMDMAGNASEWVADQKEKSEDRVVCGGNFKTIIIRLYKHSWDVPDNNQNKARGFRCAKSLK